MNESNLMRIAMEIVEMTDSVLGITGKVLGLPSDDYKLIKGLFEEVSGHELKLPNDAVEMRKILINYLKSKNVDMPEDPTYEIQQSGFSINDDYLSSWNDDSMSFGRGRK